MNMGSYTITLRVCDLTLVHRFFAGGYPSLPPTILADYYGQDFKSKQFRSVTVCFDCVPAVAPKTMEVE